MVIRHSGQEILIQLKLKSMSKDGHSVTRTSLTYMLEYGLIIFHAKNVTSFPHPKQTTTI